MKVEWLPFGELLALRRDQVKVELESSYREIGVRAFGRGLFLKEPLSGAQLGDKRVFWIEEGDVVVSNVFAWEGAVAVARREHNGLIGSHRFMTWVVGDRVLPEFVAHFLTSDRGIAALGEASPGSAGRNRTLSIKNLETLKIPVPCAEFQHAVVDHLDRLRAVGLREGVPARWARAFRTRVIGDAVESQPRQALGEFLTPVPGDSVIQDANYDIAGVFSFGRGLLRRPSLQGAQTKYKTLTRLTKSAVVYSKLGAFEGAVAVVDDEFSGRYVSPEFPTFQINGGDVAPDYLRHYMTSLHFQEALASVTSGVGARQKRVAPAVFLAQTVPVPSSHDQERLVAVLDRADQVQERADRAATLRRAMLPAVRNEIFNGIR